MGQTLVKNYLHIIFGTKHRQPFIDCKIRNELHHYLGGTCNRLECQSLKVGGYYDHVHILCMLSKNIALKDFIQELKANSSKWIKSKGDAYSNFYWQGSYGAFSVEPDRTADLIRYISSQEEHHRVVHFKEEYERFLIENGVEFSPQYLWE